MENQKSRREIAEDWLKFAVENWRNNIDILKVRSTDHLYNSFKTQIIGDANGDSFKITLAYAWYGMYVDAGVGKGMPVGSAKELGDRFGKYRDEKGRLRKGVRKPKKWFTKRRDQIGYQVFKLSVLFADQRSKDVANKLGDSFPQVLTVKF